MSNLNYTEVIETLIKNNAVKATKYISPKFIIRAVRRLFGKKIKTKDNIEIILTIGRPNYAERIFIKDCQKAGEPFPVKKIQLKLYNIIPRKLKSQPRS